MIFMSVDMLGGIFSILSLIFRDHFDVVASVSYVSVVVGIPFTSEAIVDEPLTSCFPHLFVPELTDL